MTRIGRMNAGLKSYTEFHRGGTEVSQRYTEFFFLCGSLCCLGVSLCQKKRKGTQSFTEDAQRNTEFLKGKTDEKDEMEEHGFIVFFTCGSLYNLCVPCSISWDTDDKREHG